MSPSRKKARQFLVLLALAGSLLPSCLDGSERSAHLSASAHNNIVAFVEDYSEGRAVPSFYFPPAPLESLYSDPDKRILALLRGTSFQEAGENFDIVNDCVLSYGSLRDSDYTFTFELSASHTCACMETTRDLAFELDNLFHYYSLDKTDGDAIFAMALAVKAEVETSHSMTSLSSTL
jgi:hypothetical protein